MSFGPPNASSSTPSEQGPNKALLIKRIIGQQVEMGDAVQISGATDRESQIRLTLDRLKADKLKQAQLEADELIHQAKENINGMLRESQEKANAIEAEGLASKEAIQEEARQQGYAAGYQAGYDDGVQAAESDTHAMLLSANVLLVRAYDAQKAVLGNIAPQASKIMQALVERVVHHQLDHLTVEQWQHWYQCALEQLDTSSRYRLVVGTESYHRLQQFSKTLGQLVSPEAATQGFERIKLELDPHLAAHEIYIIADEGMVDVSPSTQIDQYIEAITPEVLGLESVESFEINPDDEEEQLESLSEQLESILYFPLGPKKKEMPEEEATSNSSIAAKVEETNQGISNSLPSVQADYTEPTAIEETFVPDPWEMESSVLELSPATMNSSPEFVTEASDSSFDDSLFEAPLAELMELPEESPMPLDVKPFEFPTFDLGDGLESESYKSPFEDEFS